MGGQAAGILAGVGAGVIWGLNPIYFAQLAHVPAPELLCHRVAWGAVFVSAFCLATGRWPRVSAIFADRRALAVLAVSACLITVNWLVFLFAIQAGRATEAGFGYYIMPLVSVAFGVVLLGERLGPLQWAAVALAAVAVAVLGVGLGAVPVVPLVLAISITIYGYLRKRIATGAIVGFQVEVLLLLPLAAAGVLAGELAGTAAMTGSLGDSLLLVLAGPITGLPLILFAEAARRLPYATAGLIQYVNPTLQVGGAALVLGEPFTRWHLAALVLIWAGLALYSVALLRGPRASAAATASTASAADPTTVR